MDRAGTERVEAAELHDRLGAELFRRAKSAQARGDLIEAAELYGKAAETRRWDSRLQAQRALCEWDLGSKAEALVLSRKAVRLGPRQPFPISVLGKLLTRTGNLAEAERCLERAVDAESDNPFYLSQLANCLARAQKLEDAQKRLYEALLVDPGFELARSALSHLGVDPSRSEREALAPRSFAEFCRAGSAHFKSGHCDEAATMYTEALAIRPASSRIRALLALCMGQLGRPDTALEQAEGAFACDPDSAIVVSVMGRVLTNRGDPIAAVAYLEKAAWIEPDVVSHLLHLVWCYEALDRHSDARYVATQILTLDPVSAEAAESLGHVRTPPTDAASCNATQTEAFCRPASSHLAAPPPPFVSTSPRHHARQKPRWLPPPIAALAGLALAACGIHFTAGLPATSAWVFLLYARQRYSREWQSFWRHDPGGATRGPNGLSQPASPLSCATFQQSLRL